MQRHPPDPEKFLAAALARHDPAVAARALAARALVRSQLGTATEEIRAEGAETRLGYCLTDYATDGVAALVVSTEGVILSFRQLRILPGTEGLLVPSPDGTAQIIRVDEAVFRSPLLLKAILRAAATQATPRLPRHGPGKTKVARASEAAPP